MNVARPLSTAQVPRGCSGDYILIQAVAEAARREALRPDLTLKYIYDSYKKRGVPVERFLNEAKEAILHCKTGAFPKDALNKNGVIGDIYRFLGYLVTEIHKGNGVVALRDFNKQLVELDLEIHKRSSAQTAQWPVVNGRTK
jgi:hypothetical protein